MRIQTVFQEKVDGMEKKERQKEYQVQARISMLTTIDISAKTLDDAIAKSKDLAPTDFVETIGDCFDSNFRVVGVYESDPKL